MFSGEQKGTDAVAQRCYIKKVFLKIPQNSLEKTCVRVSFVIKLQASGLRPVTLLKKVPWHRCFPVNFAKFLRTPFLNPKTAGGRVNLTSPCGFSKNVSSKDWVKPWFFVTFNIIFGHIFPGNFIEFPQVVQEI